MIKAAMILAAGLGTRMRPLTNTCPKPLIAVDGKSLLDHALDRLMPTSIHNVVINAHYKAEMVETHLEAAQKTYMPHLELKTLKEDVLLETGGGIKNALNQGALPDGVSLIINADLLLVEKQQAPSIDKLQSLFDPEKMDVLLLIKETTKAHGFHDIGDYYKDPQGRLTRRLNTDEKAPFVFIGTFLVNSRCYQNHEVKPFSNLEIFDKAQKEGRLYGCLFDGDVYHVGTVEDLEKTEKFLKEKNRSYELI